MDCSFNFLRQQNLSTDQEVHYLDYLESLQLHGCEDNNYQNFLELLQESYMAMLNSLVLRRECYIHDIKFQFRKILLTAELKTFNPVHFF